MKLEFKNLKLSVQEQYYLESVAVRRYVRDGMAPSEAWMSLLLEELQRAGFVITPPSPEEGHISEKESKT